MGGRGSSSGMAGGGSSAKTEPLKEGETAFARLTPNWLHKDGEVVIAQTSDGGYVYKVGWDKTDYKVDTSSDDYKRALREYNVNAQFNADGTVTVTKGGLFSRKAKFKSTNDFYKEAAGRLDKRKGYYDRQAETIKSGRISQVAAEVYKGYIRNDEPNALRKIGKDLKSSLQSARTQSKAAQDMKERLINAVNQADEKRRKK